MLWRSDDVTAPALQGDHLIQFAELALIEHDPSTRKLWLYRAVFPPEFTSAQVAAANWTSSYDDLIAAGAPETFKALQYVQGVPLATNVRFARIAVRSADAAAAQAPAVDLVLTFEQNGQQTTRMITATLRSADLAPLVAWQSEH
jgi:hypothetical protein